MATKTSRSARVLAALSAALVLGACSPGRGFEAFRLLQDIAAGPHDSALKRTTAPPVRREISYTVGGTAYSGDLYRPGGEAAAAVAVVVPGLAERGKDDPRLVAFARSLARARFAVLVPALPGMRALRVDADDAIAIADTVRFAVRESGSGEGDSVALVAFSYAAGPALIAALDEGARDSVRFVFAVGAYYDIEAAITYLTTGHYRSGRDGPWRKGRPNPQAKWVFLAGNSSRLEAPEDRDILKRIAEIRRRDPDAGTTDLADLLGPDGKAVYRLLTNDDPERVGALLAALPESIAAVIRALDLSGRNLSQLAPRLYLVHGADDPMVPATESRALAAAVPEGRARLYVVDSLSHVNVGAGGIGDAVEMWRAAYALLSERDAMPPPARWTRGITPPVTPPRATTSDRRAWR